MKCTKCNKDNRPIARFCKWCGSAIIVPDEQVAIDRKPNRKDEEFGFDSLIGKSDIVRLLRDVVGKARSMDIRCRRFNMKQRMNLSFVVTGESGTGKLTVAKAIGYELYHNGLISKEAPVVISPVDYPQFIKNLDKNEETYGACVIIVKDAHKLVNDIGGKQVEQIDSILKYVRNWREDPTKPVVVFTGLERLKEFFDNNPATAAEIDYFYDLPSLRVKDMADITVFLLKHKYHLAMTEEAKEKLCRIFNNDLRHPNEQLRPQGHNAASKAYEIDLAVCQLGGHVKEVDVNLVEGTEYCPKTYEDIKKEFEKCVGIEEVKKAVEEIAYNIEEQRRMRGEDAVIKLTDHYQFLGNPGTGKTTMARLFAEALNALGALPIGQLVEVSRADLVSNYVGDTAKRVMAKFDEAMGGVLFIDEAYSLKNSENDNFGQEAIDTIITCAENRRGKLVVIIAGYTKEMGEFMEANSGLASRFNKVVNFPDYNGAQLTQIFKGMLKHSEEHYVLSSDAEIQVGNFFDRMYQGRVRTFGNAREVRNVFNRAVSSLRSRMVEARKNGSYHEGEERIITMNDIEGEETGKVLSVDEVLASLNDIIGMDQVKEQLKSIAKKVRNERRRAEMGAGNASLTNIHIAITGNPGTGKTMIAKRLGQVFRAMGVLSKGHVVERERKTLLNSYANSAGINMDKAVDEAMGGILFIDEAYNLIPMNTPGQKDADGVAAVEALMTRMSNDAGKFVTVIAGYKQEIEEFIANANPGLSRRFTHRIHIDDYSADDLVKIFKQQVDKGQYQLTPDAETLLTRKIEEMVTTKSKNFGNAGTIISLFNETISRQADRLPYDATLEQLATIEAEDIPYNPPKKVDMSECMKELDSLVGLKAVKEAVREMADTLVIEQMRAKESGKSVKINLDHYLFVGNPGTGKTTVARIMGNIFYSLGLLPSNKVVEVTSKDLIAKYVGQTAEKTAQQIERSLGGIFFIDEAYSLCDSGFGKEAMPVLLTKLLDYKGRFVSIAAGYPKEMKQWLATNSGLESRYTRTIHFEDYTAEELAEIFRKIVLKNEMRMTQQADDAMCRYFSDLVYNKTMHFANAREVNNYYDRVKLNQGRRLRKRIYLPNFDRADLHVFEADDMLVED